MSDEISPFLQSYLYDHIYIASIESPGICTIEGAAREHDWDVKRGPGSQGAQETYRGKPPAKFSVTFKLWTQVHFDDWVTFQSLLEYDPTKKTIKAVDIWSPQLDALSIRSVVTTSIGQLDYKGEGMWERKVEFLEYYPAKKKNATSSPNASTPNSGNDKKGTQAPSAEDAQMAEIARLLAEAQKP